MGRQPTPSSAPAALLGPRPPRLQLAKQHRQLVERAQQRVLRDERLAFLKSRPQGAIVEFVVIFLLAEADGFELHQHQDDLRINILMAASNARRERHNEIGALTPAELLIRTPCDVSRIVRLAMDRAGFSPGQIALKTGIHRSQVYNLSTPNGALPREPDQLLKTLHACRMPARQIDLLLVQWRLLRERRRRGLPLELSYLAAENSTVLQRDVGHRPAVATQTDRETATPRSTQLSADTTTAVKAASPSPGRTVSTAVAVGVVGKVQPLWGMITALLMSVLATLVAGFDINLGNPDTWKMAITLSSTGTAVGTLAVSIHRQRAAEKITDRQLRRWKPAAVADSACAGDCDAAVHSADGVYRPRLAS